MYIYIYYISCVRFPIYILYNKVKNHTILYIYIYIYIFVVYIYSRIYTIYYPILPHDLGLIGGWLGSYRYHEQFDVIYS